MTENVMTGRVESGMGALFIVIFAGFFIGFLFLAIKNFESDSIVLDASQTQVVTMSSTERQLIAQWIKDNNIAVPQGKGYSYLEHQYPDRPWLNGPSN